METSTKGHAAPTVLTQLDRRRIQAQLTHRFNQNLNFFKVSAPTIFERFSNFSPKRHRLILAKEGVLTLVDTLTGRSIYNQDPAQLSANQFDNFSTNPLILRPNFLKSNVTNKNYIHAPTVNELLDLYSETKVNKTNIKTSKSGILLILGAGLGYHINLISENTSIPHVILIEPDEDSFHASLHIIDWKKILGKYSVSGKSFRFLIGSKSEESFNAIANLRDTIGFHHFSNTCVFKHIESKPLNDFQSFFSKNFFRLSVGIGFYDDEKISVIHTLENLKAGAELFSPAKDSVTQKIPVIVVGNGPSLDDQIEKIKDALGKAVVISCGSTLASLYKANIKPHFHVEVERTLNSKDWILAKTDENFRKGIILLTINTCSPSVTQLFDKTVIAAKGNDAGSILSSTQLNITLHELDLCNPTVANCGVSYAINMGFKELYLVGVDLGQRACDFDHSKLSFYNDSSSDNDTLLNTYPKWKSENQSSKQKIFIDGNDGNKIETSVILDQSRNNIEQILARNPTVKCFNTGKGANIRYTTLTDTIDLPNISDVQWESSTATTKTLKQSPGRAVYPEIVDSFIEAIGEIEKIILNEQDLETAFNLVWIKVKSFEFSSPTIFHLVKGSINCLSAIVVKYLNGSNEPTLEDSSRNTYIQFLKKAKHDISRYQAENTRDTKMRLIYELKKQESVAKINPAIWPVENLNTCGFCGPFTFKNKRLFEKVKQSLIKSEIKSNLNLHRHSESIKELLSDKFFVNSLKYIANKNLNLWRSQLLWSFGRSEDSIEWNHGKQFQNGDDPIDFSETENQFQVYLALSPVTLDNAPIKILLGTHNEKLLKTRSTKPFYNENKAPRKTIDPIEHGLEYTSISINEGDYFVFHSGLLRTVGKYTRGAPAIFLNLSLASNEVRLPDQVIKDTMELK